MGKMLFWIMKIIRTGSIFDVLMCRERRSMKADIIVKGIIFNRKCNKLLLVQRSNADEVGAGIWEGVGGRVEPGETPEEAIRREIREETGITEVKIGRIAYVTLVNSKAPRLFIAYLCEVSTDAVMLSDEHQAFLWASEDECRKMLAAAIMVDFEKNGIFEILWGKNLNCSDK